MSSADRRMVRERATIQAVIAVYCHDRHHRGEALCPDCRELVDYALLRLDKCPFRQEKPTCANCSVHCYKPAMRAKVREAMRYAGPRMLWRHPILALWHLIDGRRSSKPRPAGSRRAG